MSLLYESFGFFVQWPFAALAPAALFLAAGAVLTVTSALTLTGKAAREID